MSTQEIDDIVVRVTKEMGGICATLGFEGFPKSCCTSFNDQVCHGIPSEEDILEDGDTDEKLALARQIMEENGTNYPNVLPSDDMTFLADVSSFPTSFFVDKEGRILCYPLSGAALDEYEATVDRLLEGETVSGITMPDAGANNEGVYRVIVKDRQGDMIQGVTIQFCDDTTCNIGKTDADGVASFDLPEGTEYIVHVLKVPEGYEKDSGEYHTLNVYSDVVIVLGAA